MNATLIAQVLNFILILCLAFLIIFVPVLFIKLDRRTKNIEDLLIKLRKDLLRGEPIAKYLKTNGINRYPWHGLQKLIPQN
jgi:hypothetical protein